VSATALPVVFLAFSNDRDAYLAMIDREDDNIFHALRQYDDALALQVRRAERTSIEKLFEQLDTYRDGIVIFHYGGHANGSALQLMADDGAAQMAYAGGLAGRLGAEKALQVVFLNGCATKGQVARMLASGVKAVIATSAPINDIKATEFAEQFYRALASQATLGGAFDSARDFIATKYGPDQAAGIVRDIGWSDETPAAPADPGATWGLYVNAQAKNVVDWKLPQTPEQRAIVRNAGPVVIPEGAMSQPLIDALAKALTEVDPEFAMLQQIARGERRAIRTNVIDRFPAPIALQLRAVLAYETPDRDRLQLLVLTYEITVKLFCFAVLAQLWDKRLERPDLVIEDKHRAVLDSFMTLSEATAATFDYLNVILAVVRIFTANGLTPFMPECGALEASLTDDDSRTAHAFMQEMRTELKTVPDDELESFCDQALKHLATLMSDMAFVARYRPTSIKRITLSSFRKVTGDYTHKEVTLDRLSAGLMEEDKEYKGFTDSGSVLLKKDYASTDDCLNLTPFVIDENALVDAPLSKLFFLSYYDAASDSYHYQLVENPEETLVVSARDHPKIKAMLDEFKAVVFPPSTAPAAAAA
jgi:hypothetical protein